VYYRRSSYPDSGLADVPDSLWEEFQRIRSHLSDVDQNNVHSRSMSRDSITPPDDVDHNGVSDIVDESGAFLYASSVGSPLLSIETIEAGRWLDLGADFTDVGPATDGVRLRAVSRGPAPWIVASSVEFRVKGSLGSDSYGNASLRIKSSVGGMSVATSTGGFNRYTFGCSIGVVSVVFAQGGPIQFSPSIQVNGSSNVLFPVEVTKANIFAFGLYR